jgi:PAS domain S-box-containing protein
VAVLALATALAAVIATLLGRTLARPILELDRTADAVSAAQDYSLRARQYGRDELGRLTAAFNTMLATTEKSVGALRESERRFRVLADDAPVLIWLADADRQYVWLNQRWLDFTGRPLSREVGEGWAENLHPDDRKNVLRHFAAATEQRREFQMEYRLRRHDGIYRWLLSRGLPRFSATGNFTGFIGSCIDVSDRKLAEQAVAEARDRAVAASKAKDNFLAALSHELRTPLTPVLLLASEEANNPRLPAAIRADFEMIAKNVALEARLIDDLLDLTRITRGKLTLDLRPADAHVILQDALNTVREDFVTKRIDLRVKFGAPRHHVQGDPVRLQQVFWNVLKNAAKFTPDGGSVLVETSLVDHDRWLARVTDTGIGLTPEELERIFDAFAQGDHADTPARHKFGGLGMGLAISERLAELHGGALRARSPGRNQGATFEIELPVLPAPVLVAAG